MTLSVEGARGILEEEWDSVPGISAFILACMGHCQRAPSLPADRGIFLFVCLFVCLPESIGSNGKQVVDALCEFQWYHSRQVPGDPILVHQLWNEATQ